MNQARFCVAITAAFVLLITSVGASDLGPQGVSPGAPDRIAQIGVGCPAFSWEATPGAEWFELVVYRLDADAPTLASIELTSDNEVLSKSISGRAMAWTPEAADCFAPGDRYVWFVRAVTDADTGEGSEWSQPRFFEVAAAPSANELERALEVLRRWEAANGDASPMLSSAAAPAAASTSFPDSGSGTRSGSIHLKSVITGATAIRGLQSDLTGETYGVVGISNSPDGAGVAAANSNGGPDLVLDGSEDYLPDAEFSESGINRPWGTPQTFNIRNSTGSGMTLQVDGVEVVTTATDQDAVGALSCAAGEVAKYNGSAWNCAPDDDTTYSAGGGLTLLASEFSITPDGVTAAHLAADSVTASQIAANAVGISELDIGAIFEPVQNSFKISSVLVDTIASTGQTVATLAINAPSTGSVLAVMSALYFCNNCSVANDQAAVYCTLSTSPSAAASSGDNIFLSQYYNPYGQARESLSIHDVFDVSAGTTTVYFRCGIQTPGDLMYVTYPHFSLIFIPD